jgi:hypothetical protein
VALARFLRGRGDRLDELVELSLAVEVAKALAAEREVPADVLSERPCKRTTTNSGLVTARSFGRRRLRRVSRSHVGLCPEPLVVKGQRGRIANVCESTRKRRSPLVTIVSWATGRAPGRAVGPRTT